MYLGDGLAGSCKIQRWLESYSCEAGTSRRRVLGRVSKTSLCGKASGQFWNAGNCREISLRPRRCKWGFSKGSQLANHLEKGLSG